MNGASGRGGDPLGLCRVCSCLVDPEQDIVRAAGVYLHRVCHQIERDRIAAACWRRYGEAKWPTLMLAFALGALFGVVVL